MSAMAATAGLPTSIQCLYLSSARQYLLRIGSTASQSAFWRFGLTKYKRISALSSSLSPSHSRITEWCWQRDTCARAAQSSAQNDSVTDDRLEIAKQRLRELSESLELPANFLERLPSDLRVDLKDAAFALASGALNNEVGQQAGDLLMQLSRAWETGDTQAALATAKQLPTLLGKLPSESSFECVGTRFVRAGRHFTATGQYESGELQKIGKAFIVAGEAFSGGTLPVTKDATVSATKAFKFGDLQVEITAQRAYIGAAISLAFGLLSWQLTSGVQNQSESSMQYANDNAILLATSLRGTLLAAGYACTLLSAFTMVGLLVLASGLNTDKN